MTLAARSILSALLLVLLSACATTAIVTEAPHAEDPWEQANRQIHAFNMGADRYVLRPVAVTYTTVVPRPIRRGLNNVFTNLRSTVSIVNLALQGRGRDAGEQLGRFLINTVYGVGGLWDVASDGNLPDHSTDMGLTLASWGWDESRFIMLPLLGPSTVRDGSSWPVDRWIDPVWHRYVQRVGWSVPVVSVINTRANLLPLDEQLDSAFDSYSFLRDSWLQRRHYQIQGDLAELPDYDAFLDELDDF
jgi:phospholipid-binding lipoprotein MlaA